MPGTIFDVLCKDLAQCSYLHSLKLSGLNFAVPPFHPSLPLSYSVMIATNSDLEHMIMKCFRRIFRSFVLAFFHLVIELGVRGEKTTFLA
jgi:hypothetical protein